jgi:hypothetical protein
MDCRVKPGNDEFSREGVTLAAFLKDNDLPPFTLNWLVDGPVRPLACIAGVLATILSQTPFGGIRSAP